ncbi:unnamed protein product [Auanema sp. JU1783]|nr:unnamed protein product [Auanema sp. JU1783]
MEIVKTIIHPKSHDNISIDEEEKLVPEVGIWLKEIDSVYLTFLVLSTLFTVTVILLGTLHLYYVLRYVSNDRIQTDLYYLVFMFPITSSCGLAGMYIPRAAIFLYAVSLVYFMFCLFVIVSLLFNIFGSRKEMSEYLQQNNIMISFKVPPVCCLSCLPKVISSDENLRRIEWLVFQTPIIRTTLELISVVVFMELGHRHNMWFMFSQLFGLISMCVAFYGCYIIVPLGRKKHTPYRFDFIFRVVDIAQCIYTIQKFCFDFASAFDLIAPDQNLTSAAKAQFWSSFMMTWEMMLLSALTTYCLRPSKTVLFDKYSVIDVTTSTSSQPQVEVDNTMNIRNKTEEHFDEIA